MTAAETTAVRPVRHEAKFVLPPRRAPAVLECLRHLCAPDPRYPANVVNSLYYDTPDLALLNAKEQSDYLKCKVRVRWYSGCDGAAAGPAWLEIKKKEGARSEKHRVELPVDVAALHARPLEAARRFDLLEWADAACRADVRSLRPAAVMRYTRHRFIEMASGHRVALDHDIRSTDLNPDLFPLARPRAAGWAVLEIKGTGARALPASLGVLERFDVRKASFSKYAECVRVN